jgi:thioredoxin-related protein
MKKIIFLFALFATLLMADSIIKRSTEIPMTGKPIMFIFDSKTCPYCEKLEGELNNVTFLNDLAKQFDVYAIPRDDHKIYKLFGKDVSTQELQMSYHVKATPNVVIFNKKAEKMFQMPGYISPLPLSKMLEFTLGVDSGKYQKSEWAKYLYSNNVTASEKPKPKSKQHH